MVGAHLRAGPALGAAIVLALALSSPSSASSTSRGSPAARARPSWHTQPVVSSDHYVGGDQLSVAESGAAVLAWVQGTPPRTCSQGPCGGPGRPWPGFKVMFAQGTAAHGFGSAHELAAHGYGGVYAAQLSSGVAYVAWNEFTRPGWRIVAVRHGHVSKPTVLPASAQLQGLFAGRTRQAAAVWVSPGKPRWSIHYAFLGPHGGLGRQGDIARISVPSFTYPQISINDLGDLAAVWAEGPKVGTAVMAWCDAHGHCMGPRVLSVPNATPYSSVAVTDTGTVAGMFGTPTGLWTAVGHIGRTGLRLSKLARGTAPIAVAEGRAGVAAIFQSSPLRLARTFLKPGSGRFTRPVKIEDSHATAPPQLAANLKGDFVSAWFHVRGRSYQLRVSTGAGASPHGGSRRVVAGPSRHPGWAGSIWSAETNIGTVGIAGNRDALVVWQHFTSKGPHGLFVGVHPGR